MKEDLNSQKPDDDQELIAALQKIVDSDDAAEEDKQEAQGFIDKLQAEIQ